MTQYSTGPGVTQVEAKHLLKDEGRFVADVELPRQTYAHFLRSPHAHADIIRIDLRGAAQLPGVVAVLTGEDDAADGPGSASRVFSGSNEQDIRYDNPLGAARHR